MKLLFYVVLLCANICIAQQTDIIWSKPVRVTINGNSITKSQNGQKASAKSENILDPNTNGWAEFKVTETGVKLGFGFIKSTSNNNEVDGEIDFANMDYSIQLFNNNTVKIYKEGDLYGQFGSYSVGSIFRIERLNNQIKFYKNGVLLTTITNNGIPSKAFVVNGVIQSNGSSITLGKSSFVKPLTMTSSVTDVHCQSTTNLGSISISISGGIQPYTYLWSNGATTASLNSIKSGVYALVATDATNKTISKSFTVLNCVDWTDLKGVTLNGTVLTKTATTLWGNSGAASENVLEGGNDGFMQFIPGGNVKYSAIGLTFLNTDNNYISIDYSFLIDHKRLFIFSSGKLQGDFGRIKNSDILKIERKAETILYYKNDILIFKEPTKPEMDLVVDVAFNKMNDYFENIKTTFFSKPSLTGIVKNYDNDEVKGSISLNVKGGYAPYNFAWNDVKIPSNLMVLNILNEDPRELVIDTIGITSNLDSLRRKNKSQYLLPGNYPVTIYDVFDDSKKIVGVVGTKIDWLTLKNTTLSSVEIPSRNIEKTIYLYDKGDNITQSGQFQNGLNYAISDNNFRKDYNNVLEFTIQDIRDVVYIGLIEKQQNIIDGIEDLKQKTYFEFVGKESFRIWFGDGYIFESKYSTGDVFGFENNVSTGDISFFHNRKEIIKKKLEDINPDNDLLLKILFGSPSARVSNIVMKTFPMPIGGASKSMIKDVVADVSCGKPCSGSIDVYGTTNIFSIPKRYELIDYSTGALMSTIYYTSGPNHAIFTGLCAGKYTVNYYFDKFFPLPGGTFSTTKTFEVAYIPDWINDVNVTQSVIDKSLTKTGGGVYNWDAGASSINILDHSKSGWIEWSSPSIDGINGIGFSTTDVDPTINTIKYGVGYVRLNFGIWGLWNLYVKTNLNTMIGALSGGDILRPYTTTDKFRLEKDHINHKITLSVNGTLIDQFNGVSATDDYVLDAALKLLNGNITTPRISFGCPSVLTKDYAVLKVNMDGHFYILDGNHLNFTIDGEYTINTLKFQVLDNKRNIVISNNLNSNLLNKINLKLGDNRYYLDCNTLATGYYTLEVVNEKNEKLVLRFKR
jgi:hypothetical protein